MNAIQVVVCITAFLFVAPPLVAVAAAIGAIPHRSRFLSRWGTTLAATSLFWFGVLFVEFFFGAMIECASPLDRAACLAEKPRQAVHILIIAMVIYAAGLWIKIAEDRSTR